jgi:hypothetical protein
MAISNNVQRLINTGSTYHSERASNVTLTGYATVAASVRSYEKQLNNLMADAQRSRAEADALADQQSAISSLDFPAGDDQAPLYADPADIQGVPAELTTPSGRVVNDTDGKPVSLSDEQLRALGVDSTKLPCEHELSNGGKIYITADRKVIAESPNFDTDAAGLRSDMGDTFTGVQRGAQAVRIEHEDATALLASIQKRQSALQMEDQLRTLQMTQTLNSIAQMIEAASNLSKKASEIAENLARNIA